MSRRIRINASPLTMDDVIRITGEIAHASHVLRVDTEKMNKRIDALKATYEEAHNALASEISDKTKQLAQWAAGNPKLFATSRSIEFPRAIIGFRLGQPNVKLAKDVSLADAVTGLLQLPNGEQYITQPEPTINKAAIIAQRKEMKAKFAECGITVGQTDRFYVDPKAEEPVEAILT